MTNEYIMAEEAGREFFNNNQHNSTYRLAERKARINYNSVLLQECFVAGWNNAFWDEQSRVLKQMKGGMK